MAKQKRKITYELRSYGLTNPGDRDNNEDVFAYNDRLGVYVLCDGMGGHAGGEFASAFTSQEIMDALYSASGLYRTEDSSGEPTLPSDDLPNRSIFAEEEARILRYAVWQTNQKLHKLAVERAKGGPKMGTTVVALWVLGEKVWSLNIGDSRAYGLWDKQLYRLTRDDCWVSEQILVGSMKPEEAKKYRSRITKAVGTDPEVESQINSHTLPYSGGRFLLCCDGFYDHVPPEGSNGRVGIKELMSIPDLKEACQKMIEAATQYGKERQVKGEVKKRDNITVVLIDVKMYGVTLSQGSAEEPSFEDTLGNL